jgi:hypothetical protein
MTATNPVLKSHDPARVPLVVQLPIRTVSEANAHEHWRVRQKRAKEQRGTVAAFLRAQGNMWRDFGHGYVIVILTRIASRALDSDNLQGAMKHVRDGVADAINGGDDRDERIEWRYAQRRGASGQYAVEIDIRRREPNE